MSKIHFAVGLLVVASACGPAPGPEILRVEKMGGNLHVYWDLHTQMEEVQVWRKTVDYGVTTVDYRIAYTLPGATTNKHDAEAVPPLTYCYKVQGIAGELATGLSPERCEEP
jgi:hypothetical protein